MSCARMDTVTYPDARVKRELSHFVFRRIDINEHRDVARLFDVVVIPIAVVVTSDGDELARIEQFVEPEAFRGLLERVRRGKDRE